MLKGEFAVVDTETTGLDRTREGDFEILQKVYFGQKSG